MNTIQTIGTTATPIILLLAAAAFLIYRAWRKRGGALPRDTAALRRIEEQIEAAALGIVSEIESAFGGKAGPLKRAAAMERVIALIPEKYRGAFDADAIAGYVEDALSEAKLLWAKLNALRDQEPTQAEEPALAPDGSGD